jgi:hypothetical protein
VVVTIQYDFSARVQNLTAQVDYLLTVFDSQYTANVEQFNHESPLLKVLLGFYQPITHLSSKVLDSLYLVICDNLFINLRHNVSPTTL